MADKPRRKSHLNEEHQLTDHEGKYIHIRVDRIRISIWIMIILAALACGIFGFAVGPVEYDENYTEFGIKTILVALAFTFNIIAWIVGAVWILDKLGSKIGLD